MKGDIILQLLVEEEVTLRLIFIEEIKVERVEFGPVFMFVQPMEMGSSHRLGLLLEFPSSKVQQLLLGGGSRSNTDRKLATSLQDILVFL